MACHWVENPATGKWEQLCSDSGTPVVPGAPPNPVPIPTPENPPAWMWPTTKPKGEHLTGTYTSMYTSGGKTYQHNAIDIGIVTGTKVLAPHAGKVVIAGWDNSGYGNLVKIVFENFSILLGHLSEIDVKPGQMVQAGDVVGLSGSTGNSSGPHLHFEVRSGNNPIDPMQFFGSNPRPGTPGNPGTPQPVPTPELVIPIAPDKNGVYQPTDPNNPLAKMGYKTGSGTYVPVDAPANCLEIWKTQGFDAAKTCYINAAKALAGASVAGSVGTIGEEIGKAIAAAFSIPTDPEERKIYATRWIVGGVAMLLLLLALYALISMNRTGRELVREYVGVQNPVNTQQLVTRLKEKVGSNGKV